MSPLPEQPQSEQKLEPQAEAIQELEKQLKTADTKEKVLLALIGVLALFFATEMVFEAHLFRSLPYFGELSENESLVANGSLMLLDFVLFYFAAKGLADVETGKKDAIHTIELLEEERLRPKTPDQKRKDAQWVSAYKASKKNKRTKTSSKVPKHFNNR